MKNRFVLAALASFVLAPSVNADLVINFDTDGNWAAGSGNLTSYQDDHQYSESGIVFSAINALRNTTSTQDSFAGALGTYSWRLRNASGSALQANYATVDSSNSVLTGFSFDVRRWDGSPEPVYDVLLSTNSGGSFTSVGTINNTFLGGSSDWSTFTHTLSSATAVTDGQFRVQIANTSGERIMVDNFTISAVPEPGCGMILGVLGAISVMRRRRLG